MSPDSITHKKGEIAFTCFNNYSGVSLETPTKTLVFDPADVNPGVFKNVDALLITHEHYDHFDEDIVKDIHRRTQCLVIADSISAKRLKDAVAQEKLRDMKVGKEIRFDEIIVRAEVFKHPAAAPVSYMITTEDGVRVYHTGDSMPHPDMKHIGERNPADLVFCAVGAPAPGTSPQSGLEIVRMVRPKAATPYHAPLNDLKRFAELIAKEIPQVKCLMAEQNKPVKYP